MTNVHLNEGEAFVEGRSAEKARELIERAEAAGLSASVVSTTSFGYIVPEEILASDVLGLSEEETKEEAPEADANADAPEAPVAQFDPNEATVAEVREYLAGADEEEAERVLAAERAGQARKTLLPDTSEEK